MPDAPHSVDDKTLAFPSSRFANAGEVREVCDALIKADKPRGDERARVQGLIDGNRPHRPSLLVNKGEGWRANVNYREAEGIIQAVRTPYYDLATEVDPCVEITLDYGRGQMKAEWERVLAEEAHKTIFGWDAFDWHLQLRHSEMLTFGWGTHLWLDRYDWRCRTKTMRHVLFPDETTTNLEDLEYFVVRDSQLAHQLHKYIRNEKAAAAVGWKPQAVKQAIAKAHASKQGNRNLSAEDVQASLKRGDIGFGNTKAQKIWLNHLFVIEFEGGKNDAGGITHYIIEEGGDEYLFERRCRFDGWDQILSFFPYDIGSDGTVHSVRGLGVRVFPFCELANRLKNHMVDSVLVGSGILLTQSGAGVDNQRLQLAKIGMLRVLPAGLQPAKFQGMDLGQGPLALSRELQGTMMENTKTYRQTVSDGSSRERTATEVAVTQADQARLEKSAHNLEYRGLSKWYREMVRRLCNLNITTTHPGGTEAVLFQQRCMARGVPRAAFSHIAAVDAKRSMGAGSASNRILVAQQLMQFVYPAAGPVEKNNIMRDFVAAVAGQKAVNRYVPQVSSASVPSNDDSIATLENDAMERGGEATVSPYQDHARHAARHLGRCAQLLQALQAGQADPQAVLAAWNAMGPHIALHIGMLEQDPSRKADYDSLRGQFEQLSRFSDKLAQHLEEQAQSAANAEALAPSDPAEQQQSLEADPEFRLKLQTMQAEYALKQAKLAGELALKKKKLEHQMGLADQKQAANIARQNADAQRRAYTRNGKTNTGQ